VAAILAGMAGEFPSSAFIGRASELQRLEAVLDRAEQDRPRVVLLAGDAGVGKTRLLLAFADRARRRGTRVLLGAAVELGDIGLAYLPVVDALRELVDDPEEANLLARVATTAPGLGRLLPGIGQAQPLGRLTGDGLDQLQVFDAVWAVLVGRSQQSPVMVMLEDLHWADRATRDLVAFLARTLRSGRGDAGGQLPPGRTAPPSPAAAAAGRAGPAARGGAAAARPVQPRRAGRTPAGDHRDAAAGGPGGGRPRPLGGQPVLRRARTICTWMVSGLPP
jgi:hypothetical protein